MAQWVNNPPAMQETQESQVLSLGWEDPLKKEMAIHSSILAWEVPWMKEPGGLQSIRLRESGTTEHAHAFREHTLLKFLSIVISLNKHRCGV